MKKINSNVINQIHPDSLRINIAEIEEDDVAEQTSKLFYPFQLSRTLEPYRGHFILGSHFQGYGGVPEHHEVLGQEIHYYRWMPTFHLGKISEAGQIVLAEKGRSVLSVNTDRKFAEYSMDVGIAVNNSNMPLFGLMSYWVGSDEEILAFKRALWPQIRDRPIDNMLRSLARKKVKDKQMSKDYLEDLELKIRGCRRSDEARAYASQVKAIIPKYGSTESFVYPAEEESVKTILV